MTTSPREGTKPMTKNSATRMKVHNVPQDDLVIDLSRGMAYQVDRSETVPYDNDYYKKVQDKTYKKVINKIRKDIVDKHTPSGRVFDIGCGDGSFLEMMKVGYGYDIMKKTIEQLGSDYRDFYKKIPDDVTAITCWDSLEHMPDINIFLSKIIIQILFVSIPIINDIRIVRQWVHYRPNEHFWYFTNNGFIDYMKKQGFFCIDFSDAETKSGRKDIGTFVFRRL